MGVLPIFSLLRHPFFVVASQSVVLYHLIPPTTRPPLLPFPSLSLSLSLYLSIYLSLSMLLLVPPCGSHSFLFSVLWHFAFLRISSHTLSLSFPTFFSSTFHTRLRLSRSSSRSMMRSSSALSTTSVSPTRLTEMFSETSSRDTFSVSLEETTSRVSP